MRIEWWVSHHLSPYLRCAILNLEASRQIRMQLLQNVVTHLYRLFSNQLMATISDFYPISHQLFLFLSLPIPLLFYFFYLFANFFIFTMKSLRHWVLGYAKCISTYINFPWMSMSARVVLSYHYIYIFFPPSLLLPAILSNHVLPLCLLLLLTVTAVMEASAYFSLLLDCCNHLPLF